MWHPLVIIFVTLAPTCYANRLILLWASHSRSIYYTRSFFQQRCQNQNFDSIPRNISSNNGLICYSLHFSVFLPSPMINNRIFSSVRMPRVKTNFFAYINENLLQSQLINVVFLIQPDLSSIASTFHVILIVSEKSNAIVNIELLSSAIFAEVCVPFR